jgi:hypothetical protein
MPNSVVSQLLIFYLGALFIIPLIGGAILRGVCKLLRIEPVTFLRCWMAYLAAWGADTAWTLPDTAADLEQGATYQWTVFVGGRRSGRAVPPQDFRVISLEESVELEDYIDEIAVFGLDPRGDGLFLSVVAYRDMGLFYEARRALDEVEADGPLGSELYRLKGEILAELGHEEQARAAFDRADTLAGRPR